MAGKERKLFRLILNNFLDSLKPKMYRDKLIGEDYYGTKYYEVNEKSNLKKRPSRYFIPVNQDDHEQELPVEWESWLRYRRKDPPTLDEIRKNYELQMMKKENAEKINEKFASEKLEGSKAIIQKGSHTKFPTYEEYKHDEQSHKITDRK